MSYIQTYQGKKFDLLACDPSEICIEDIAHALGNICRFAGHVPVFYSVAQHSVLMSACAMPDQKLWALLHDAPEAYTGDMPKHVKNWLGGQYTVLENALTRKVAERFSLPYPIPSTIRELDGRMLETEWAQLWDGKRFEGMDRYGAPLDISIRPWGPRAAEGAFLKTFHDLTQ